MAGKNYNNWFFTRPVILSDLAFQERLLLSEFYQDFSNFLIFPLFSWDGMLNLYIDLQRIRCGICRKRYWAAPAWLRLAENCPNSSRLLKYTYTFCPTFLNSLFETYYFIPLLTFDWPFIWWLWVYFYGHEACAITTLRQRERVKPCARAIFGIFSRGKNSKVIISIIITDIIYNIRIWRVKNKMRIG